MVGDIPAPDVCLASAMVLCIYAGHVGARHVVRNMSIYGAVLMSRDVGNILKRRGCWGESACIVVRVLVMCFCL